MSNTSELKAERDAAYQRGYDDALNDALRNGMQWAIDTSDRRAAALKETS